MRKRILTAALVVLALLAVGGICWWVWSVFFYPSNGGGDGQIDISTVFHRVELEDIQEISVKSTDSYTLKKINGVWSVEGQQVALSEERLNALLEAVATLHAHRVLENRVKRSEREELERRESGRVTVSGKNGVIYTLLIVGVSEETGNYTVLLSEKNRLYEMYEESIRPLLQSVNELRDRRFHSMSWERLKQERYLKSFQLQRPDKPLLSIRAKTDEEMRRSNSTHTHFMQSPYMREVDTEKFGQQVLVTLSMLTVKNFVEKEPSDLSIYGLTPEERTVLQVVTEDQTLILYAGKVQGGERYMQKEGESEIFTVEQESASFLNIDPFFLLEASLDMPKLEEISRIEIRGKTGNYDISFTEAQEGKISGRVNGQSVDSTRLSEWYISAMMALKVTGVLAASTAEMTPEVTITTTYKRTGNQHTVYFYPVNDLQYAVYINQEHGFSLEKKQIEQAIQMLKDLYRHHDSSV